MARPKSKSSDNNQAIIDFIEAYRKLYSLNIPQLADKVGLDKGYIYKVLDGQLTLPIRFFQKLYLVSDKDMKSAIETLLKDQIIKELKNVGTETNG